jgi:hypothetical protein
MIGCKIKKMTCIAVVCKIFHWSLCSFPPVEEKRKKACIAEVSVKYFVGLYAFFLHLRRREKKKACIAEVSVKYFIGLYAFFLHLRRKEKKACIAEVSVKYFLGLMPLSSVSGEEKKKT